eukprot:15446546-Alexandrium_andersonii.AAC.1
MPRAPWRDCAPTSCPQPTPPRPLRLSALHGSSEAASPLPRPPMSRLQGGSPQGTHSNTALPKLPGDFPAFWTLDTERSVSYTHLRAHETSAHL